MSGNGKAALSLATLFLLTSNAYAQEEQELEQITVTAQKTKENVQEVPISMTVLDGVTIEDKNIDDVWDVMDNTPGVNTTPNPHLFAEYLN